MLSAAGRNKKLQIVPQALCLTSTRQKGQIMLHLPGSQMMRIGLYYMRICANMEDLQDFGSF